MRVKVTDLQAGCMLIKDVMGKTRYPIITANTILTEQHIAVLKAFLVEEAEVRSRTESGEIFKPEERRPEEQTEAAAVPVPAVSSIAQSFKTAADLYKKEFQSWQSGIGINITNIRALLLPLIEAIEDHKGWIRQLHLYGNKEEYMYHHPVAVAAISSAIAKAMGHDKGQCMQVALAGCLADSGMAKIPERTLLKQGNLNEVQRNEVKKHPVYSYQLVKNISLLKPETKLAVLQHHERLDGSGYPMGEKGNRIHLISQIVALADMFHAMTTERLYKGKISPFRTLQIMEEDHFGQFDISILNVLMSIVASLPAGTPVRLSDGRVGEILFVKTDALTRPLVKILDTEEIVDLERNRMLFLEDVMSDGLQVT